MRELTVGKPYTENGVKWLCDRIYLEDPAKVEKYGLYYNVRFHAIVIEAPTDYSGVMEIDAGYMRV